MFLYGSPKALRKRLAADLVRESGEGAFAESAIQHEALQKPTAMNRHTGPTDVLRAVVTLPARPVAFELYIDRGRRAPNWISIQTETDWKPKAKLEIRAGSIGHRFVGDDADQRALQGAAWRPAKRLVCAASGGVVLRDAKAAIVPSGEGSTIRVTRLPKHPMIGRVQWGLRDLIDFERTLRNAPVSF